MKSRKEVDASFEAVPAYIVADKREKLGKRLGIAAICLLVLFFTISSYVQSSANGRELERSSQQRGKLVDATNRVASTIEGQTILIVQLQKTIAKQNEALAKAGLPVEPVPTIEDIINEYMSPAPSPSAVPNESRRGDTSSPRDNPPANNPSPASKPKPTPKPNPSPKPPHPSPPPNDPPGPADPITDIICNSTGICIRGFHRSYHGYHLQPDWYLALVRRNYG